MTVVAALRSADPECFLLAADSQATDAVMKTFESKLVKLSSVPLGLGVAGQSAISQEMADWLEAYPWERASWAALKHDAEEQLAKLNGKWRRLQRLSGKKPDPLDTTSALLVGYIAGEGRILKLTDRGPGEYVDQHPFAAIGSGEFHATVAYRTLVEFLRRNGQPFPRDKDGLAFVVSIAINMDPKCGGQIRIIEVLAKPHGSENSDSDPAS